MNDSGEEIANDEANARLPASVPEVESDGSASASPQTNPNNSTSTLTTTPTPTPTSLQADVTISSTAPTERQQDPAKPAEPTTVGDPQSSRNTIAKPNTATDTTNTGYNAEYAEHITYMEDGSAIYTDPQTKHQYKWSAEENKWLPFSNSYENEHYRWCTVTQKWILKDPKQQQQQQQQAVTETEHYKWDAEKQTWVLKDRAKSSSNSKPSAICKYDINENGERIYTDEDGAVFFWDVEQNAWFPKIDEDFMARYQMSYGFVDNNESSSQNDKPKQQSTSLASKVENESNILSAKASNQSTETSANTKDVNKRKNQSEPAKWFDLDPAHNTKVYVSNLPLNITLDEFAELMSKCGLIMRDPQTQKYKIKLYTEEDGQLKGDGLCDYIKVESVDLALKILDEYNFCGNKIRVQRAKFQMRGEYNPALKPKRKKKDKEKLAKIKEKLFDWRPEKMRGERSKHEKIVIVKNLFTPEIFEKNVELILDYQNDIREECSKYGQVRKVILYDHHLEGVAQINMSTPEEADMIIQMLHGRYFCQRKLTAEHWDGKTKYKSQASETEAEAQKRLNSWHQYLHEDNDATATTTAAITNPSNTENDTRGIVQAGIDAAAAVIATSDFDPSNQKLKN